MGFFNIDVIDAALVETGLASGTLRLGVCSSCRWASGSRRTMRRCTRVLLRATVCIMPGPSTGETSDVFHAPWVPGVLIAVLPRLLETGLESWRHSWGSLMWVKLDLLVFVEAGALTNLILLGPLTLL